MKYLLDTHIILWWLTNPSKITLKAKNIIADCNEKIYISSASIWEMSIKSGIGKLTLPSNIIEVLIAEGFQFLGINAIEALSVSDLPMLHNDPFDRMLIIQSKLHDLILITRDEKIIQYPVVTLKG